MASNAPAGPKLRESLLSLEPSAWAARVEEEGDEGVVEQTLQKLLRDWVSGSLEQESTLLARYSEEASPLRALRVQLASAFSGDLTAFCLEEVVDQSPLSNTDHGDATRRWCYIEGWMLLEQDEDLMFSADDLEVMLEEVRFSGDQCPKAEYILSMVTRHVRDKVHDALRTSWPSLQQACRSEPQHWIPLVEATLGQLPHPWATEAADYLKRLLTYGDDLERGPLTEEEVRQRASDVARCYPLPNPRRIRRRGRQYFIDLQSANNDVRVEVEDTSDDDVALMVGDLQWNVLMVDAETGEMRLMLHPTKAQAASSSSSSAARGGEGGDGAGGCSLQ